MFVPVSIRGTRVDYEDFERFALAVGDMSEPLAAIGERLLAGVAQQFETEGGWGGRPWKELSRNYRVWKEARVAGLPKLVGIKPAGAVGTRSNPIYGKQYRRSGKMKAELLAPRGYMVTRSRMVYAPISDIAGLHQEGTIGRGGHMPERPPVVIPLRELEEWDLTFISWIDGLAARLIAP